MKEEQNRNILINTHLKVKKTALFILVLMFFTLIGIISTSAADDTIKITSPNYFLEQNNIYDNIHYLEDEFLSFKFCGKTTIDNNIENLKFNLVCPATTTSLEKVKLEKEKGCYYSNYDLEKVNCDDFKLEITYTIDNKNKKLERTFVKQQQSLLINHILKEDKEALDDKDLSYYLLILNEIQDKSNKENQDIYESLKNNRDNSNKCWPKSDCKIDDTITILKNLQLSGYDLKSRMLDDGKYYLEKNIIKGSGDNNGFEYEIEFEFDNNVDNNCIFNIDGIEKGEYNYIEADNDTLLSLNGIVKDEFDFICDEDLNDLDLTLYDNKLEDKDYSFDVADDLFEIDLLDYNSAYEDGETLLFKIYIKEFDASETDIDCTLTIDDDETNYNFRQSDSKQDLTIEKEAQDTITFTCDQQVSKINFKLYHKELLSTSFTKEFTYTDMKKQFLSFTCFGDNKCSFYNTIDALLIFKNTLEYSVDMELYIDSLVVEDEDTTESYIDSTDEILDTAYYLYYKKNDELSNYLKYNQNNDGSWGTSSSNIKKITQTAWSVLGLQKTISTSEYVEDGEKWIYYNEPVSGWGSLDKNIISYLAIKKNLKPYLKFNSKNYMENTTTFTIENPTIYELKDLKLSLSRNIDEFCSYNVNIGSLTEDNNTIDFDITVNDNFFGEQSGKLEITGVDGKNQKSVLISIPITIRGSQPVVLIDKTDNYTVSNNDWVIEMEFLNKLKDETLNCNYVNPFNLKEEIFDLTNTSNILMLENLELKEGNFSFDLNCKLNKLEFKTKVDFNVNKIEKSFEIISNLLQLSSTEDFSIVLTNLETLKQVFEFKIEGDLNGIIEPVDTNKILAKNETREIYFKIVDKDSLLSFGNKTINSALVVIGDNGYEQRIKLDYSEVSIQKSPLLLWYYIGIGVIVLILIVLVIARYKHLNEDEIIQSQDDMYFDDSELEFK